MPNKIISQIDNVRLANSIILTTLVAKVTREFTGSFDIELDLCEELGWRLSGFVPEGIELKSLDRQQITADHIEKWLRDHPHLLQEEPASRKKPKVTEIDNRPEVAQ